MGALLSLALLAGCSKAPEPGATADTIRIGLAGVQTGNDAALGISMLNGSVIAIDEWNARGGVLGKKIESFSVDDEGNSEKAVNVASDLVSKKVVAVLGHFNSGCTIPAMTVYRDNNIVQITPGSTNPKVTQSGIKTLFRMVGLDSDQAQVNVDYLYDKLGIRKLAVIHNSTSWGEGIATEARDRWIKKGGEVVDFAGISEKDFDFNANIAVFKSKGAEAVYGGLMFAQSGPLVNKMRQEKLNIPFCSGDGSFDPEFIKAAGDNPVNVFLTFGPDLSGNADAQRFFANYKTRFGKEPGPYSIYGYEAANVLLRAIEKAGTTDAAKVAEVLHAETFKTSQGDIAFDEKGDLRKSLFVIWTVKDKKFVVVQP